jgi:molybdopterin molybdotransferase
MLSFTEAQSRILAEAVVLPAEDVPLAASIGRVLAEDVPASGPLPPFDYSAMDGYAVCTDDFTRAPVTLPVASESRAGGPLPEPLVDGTAARILTGAPIPPRANAILPQEDVERIGDTITFAALPTPGRHIRRAGEDLARGAVALPKGTRIAPQQFALLATVECNMVRVSRAPHVAILSTGDELRDPGAPARPGSIVDSNGPMLVELCRRLGAIATYARVRDDLDETRAAIRGSDCDLLLTIGGVSVGDHDHVRDALAAEGFELGFWRVAIKPGKPIAFGKHGARRVLGLPGNPAAAFVTFTLFVAPLLRAMQGDARPIAPTFGAKLAHAARGSQGRLEFARARLTTENGELTATLLTQQASGAVTSIAWADALVPLPMEPELAPGRILEVMPLF